MPRAKRPPWQGLLRLSLLGLGGATLLGTLGRVSWFGELFTHFAAQCAAGLTVTVAAALVLRAWRPALVGVLLLLPHLWSLSYFYPVPGEAAAPERSLRVLSFNVLTSNPDHKEVRDFLAGCGADIILLLETDRTWLEDLEPLRATYPHTASHPRPDNFGLALFSRHPISSSRIRQLEASGVPCLVATITVNGAALDVIGAHPVPPVSARNAAARNAYLEALAPLVAASARPTIVMGDLNLTVWSPHFRDLLQAGSLHDTGRKRGFRATWRRGNPLLAIPIDHILHTADVVCTGRTVGPDLGSDHRPVMAAIHLLDTQ